MRQIKFRALPDKNYTQMSGWYYGVDGIGKDNIFTIEMFSRHLRAGRLDIKTRCQFTGLLDKNGVEIYESDEILVGENIGTVSFKDGLFLWGDELLCEYNNIGEIIGNIYEHSELLK